MPIETAFATGKTAVFGVPAASVAIPGLEVESAEVAATNQVFAEAIDQTGLVFGLAFGGDKFDIRATGYVSLGTPPAKGDVITLSGATGMITEVTQTFANREFQKYSIVGVGYEGITMGTPP